MRESDVVAVIRPTTMLSFSWKWLGDKKPQTYCLPDFPGYKKGKLDDAPLVTKLWGMMNEADIIVAHNGDKFDQKKSQARFIINGLQPPSPCKTIDTLKIARASFGFDSNKLNDLAKYLGIGGKIPHTGMHLWLGCMNGDPASWKVMRKYNAHDVDLLEQVYLRLRPWAKNHPNLNHFTHSVACPTCQSLNTQRRGEDKTLKRSYQRFQCQDCC
jgi:hypothetical protein